jgi:non-heme Fe2+,alpha-ketoglutarate-dependent halogenase
MIHNINLDQQAVGSFDYTNYLKNGFFYPLKALRNNKLLEYQEVYKQLESKFSGKIPAFYNAKIHLLVPSLWDLVSYESIISPVRTILGENLLCLGTSFISKSGQDTKKYVAWHQDITYWGLSQPRAVTVWLALTQSNKKNGCVVVIPRSHQHPVPHVIDNKDQDNMLGRREKLAFSIDEENLVNLELNPGQISLHDGQIIHGSLPNYSGAPRVGFAMRFISSEVSPVVNTVNSATLVAGENLGAFKLESRPEAFFHTDALKAHQESFRNGMRTIFSNPKK